VRLLVLVVAAGCYSPKFAGPGDGAPCADGAPHWKKRITLQPPSTVAPLLGFPVGIHLPFDDDLRDRATRDDVVFTDDQGTRLPTEVELYRPPSGRLSAWVRVPVLQPGTMIELHYGDLAFAAGGSADPVFDERFVAVWHLSRLPYDDSVSGRDAVANGSVLGTDGIMGDAFEAQPSAWLSIPDDAALDFAGDSFSYSVWVKATTFLNDWDTPWYRGGTSHTDAGYVFELGLDGWKALVSDGGGGGDPSIATAGLMDGSIGDWYHLVAVVNRSTGELRGYVDGVLDGLDTTLPQVGSTTSASMASISRPTNSFSGAIDEVRIVNVALEADWIAIEHANLEDPAFFTVGPEEAVP
jgi:hypothetical protein